MSSKSSSSPSTATSLKDLLTKGSAQTCTFTTEKSKGTVYIDGKKMRQDFEVVVDDKTMKSHVIVIDNTFYSWEEGGKTGIKMAFDPNATSPPAAGDPNAGPNGSFDTETNMDYKCSPGVVSSNIFSLPNDITFNSFDIPSEDIPSDSSSSSSQCAYCNNLTGDDKTQCLTALKCN